MNPNPNLDRYLDDVRRGLGGMPKKEQAEILEEMRGHLEEDILGRIEKNPELSIEEATIRATHDFGDAGEIARARAASAADDPRSIPRWSPRRWSKGVRWMTGIVIVLFTCGVVAAMVLEETVGSHGDQNLLYERSIKYSGQTGTENSTFLVPTHVFTVVFDLHIHNENTTNGGCLSIRVENPSGQQVFDSGDSCGVLYQTVTFQGNGYWKVQYRFHDFVGHVDVSVRQA